MICGRCKSNNGFFELLFTSNPIGVIDKDHPVYFLSSLSLCRVAVYTISLTIINLCNCNAFFNATKLSLIPKMKF